MAWTDSQRRRSDAALRLAEYGGDMGAIGYAEAREAWERGSWWPKRGSR